MELRQRVVGKCVDSISRDARRQLLYDGVLEVIDDVAIAIDDDAPSRAEDGRAARPSVHLEPVTALPLPNNTLSVIELERGLLTIWKFPVVREVKASASRDDASWMTDAEQPAREVD